MANAPAKVAHQPLCLKRLNKVNCLNWCNRPTQYEQLDWFCLDLEPMMSEVRQSLKTSKLYLTLTQIL